MQRESSIKRVRDCGQTMGAPAAVVHRDEVSHYANVSTCGSIWACPVCSAKVRNGRAEELSLGITRHLERGGGGYFVTLTLPHGAIDPLAETLGLVTTGLASIMKGGAWRAQRARIGYVGHIRALEVTHGQNGWHPHLHVLVLTERPLSEAVMRAELYDQWRARWDGYLNEHGWQGTAPEGVQVEPVTTGQKLGQYVAKVQEKGLGNELARADLKRGRRGSRLPFRILADAATDGLWDDFQLWREYEQATRGKAAIRWSQGLRALLLPDTEELTDEELAMEKVGGDVVVFIDQPLMRAINRIPGAPAGVLRASEAGGYEAVVRYVRKLGLDVGGLHRPGELGHQQTG